MKLTLTPEDPDAWQRRLHVLAREAGVDVGPGSLPVAPSQAGALATIGPTIVRMSELCQGNPQALRWLAVALRYWSERVLACADRTDREVETLVRSLWERIDAGNADE